ncbi:MAG: AraC family transcriptional regulator [Clostridia bacterium]|nr:AraC family transcriptional regulator [Clostridia bacterium]
MTHKNFRVYAKNNLDFNVVQYGYRKCEPLFSEKPHIWPNFLFHYVHSGKGTLNVDGSIFKVQENQGFIIFPGQIANYIADGDNPFEYTWVEFFGNGTKNLIAASTLSPKTPVINDTNGKTGKAIWDLVESGEMSNALLMSKFWAFADTLMGHTVSNTTHSDLYVEKAISYIGENIGKPTTVSDVCRHLNISRNYFCNIFTESMGISPKRYILNQHMEMAFELLKRSHFSIGEIASIVGYDTQSKFTKAFTRYTGQSPSAYRKQKGE